MTPTNPKLTEARIETLFQIVDVFHSPIEYEVVGNIYENGDLLK